MWLSLLGAKRTCDLISEKQNPDLHFSIPPSKRLCAETPSTEHVEHMLISAKSQCMKEESSNGQNIDSGSQKKSSFSPLSKTSADEESNGSETLKSPQKLSGIVDCSTFSKTLSSFFPTTNQSKLCASHFYRKSCFPPFPSSIFDPFVATSKQNISCLQPGFALKHFYCSESVFGKNCFNSFDNPNTLLLPGLLGNPQSLPHLGTYFPVSFQNPASLNSTSFIQDNNRCCFPPNLSNGQSFPFNFLPKSNFEKTSNNLSSDFSKIRSFTFRAEHKNDLNYPLEMENKNFSFIPNRLHSQILSDFSSFYGFKNDLKNNLLNFDSSRERSLVSTKLLSPTPSLPKNGVNYCNTALSCNTNLVEPQHTEEMSSATTHDKRPKD